MRIARVLRGAIVSAEIVVLSCSQQVVGESSNTDETFHFCVLGDMPYYLPEDDKRFDNVIAAINDENPVFSVHVGDTKSGSSPCSDEDAQRTLQRFAKFDHPLVYTPGDNEWTDCHRKAAGSMDPLERLAMIREQFFEGRSNLGGGERMEVAIQSSNVQWAKYSENRRWMRGGVLFATLHIVGSHNNNQPNVPGAVEEFVQRDAANEEWLEGVFDEAQISDAPGIALFIHGNPFGERDSSKWDLGYARFLHQLRERTIVFQKPVLVVHGDSHYYRLDKPLMYEGATRESVENLTRLEVFGARNMHSVRVDVDPLSRQVFQMSELIVEENRRGR